MNKYKTTLFFILTISLSNTLIAMKVTKKQQLPTLPSEILITIFEHLVNYHFNKEKHCLFYFYEKINERKNLKSDLVNLRLINKVCKNLVDQYLIKNTIKLKKEIYNNLTNRIISENKLNPTQLNLKLSAILNQNKYSYKELKEGVISIICGADPNFKGKSDKTLLITLAQLGHVGLIHILLETKANIDAQTIYGNTALIEALIHNHKNIAKLLLDKNANHNLKDNKNRTTLIWAAKQGYKDIVLRLINSQDLDSQDIDGNTALIEALKHQHKNIAKLLIHKNANVNLIGENGITALILSCQKGYKDIVKLLLTKGTNTKIKDANGYTALDWAIKNRNKNLIEILTEKSSRCLCQ